MEEVCNTCQHEGRVPLGQPPCLLCDYVSGKCTRWKIKDRLLIKDLQAQLSETTGNLHTMEDEKALLVGLNKGLKKQLTERTGELKSVLSRLELLSESTWIALPIKEGIDSILDQYKGGKCPAKEI